MAGTTRSPPGIRGVACSLSATSTPAEHKWELWLAPLLPGAQPQPLLADPQWDYKHPTFNPSGDLLVYFSDEGSAGIFHLWLVHLATMERQQLTFGDRQNHCHPAISPNGKRIAFHAYEGIEMVEPAVTNLYELELATGEVNQLTKGKDQYKHPFYLTNSIITYHHQRNSDGRRRIEALDVKTGKRAKLTSGKNNDKHPFPGGKAAASRSSPGPARNSANPPLTSRRRLIYSRRAFSNNR